jgi:hypothetical protein
LGYFSSLKEKKVHLWRWRQLGWLLWALAIVGYNLTVNIAYPDSRNDYRIWLYVLGLITFLMLAPKPQWMSWLKWGEDLRERMPFPDGVDVVVAILTYPPLWILLGFLLGWEFVPSEQRHWIDVPLAVLMALPAAVAAWRCGVPGRRSHAGTPAES